jgi:aspartate/tyrosine/aromatic aminotransferase
MLLNDKELFAQWEADIKTMAGRIIAMRDELHRLLTQELHTPGSWEHIVKQIGMFRCVPLCSLPLRDVDGSAASRGCRRRSASRWSRTRTST